MFFAIIKRYNVKNIEFLKSVVILYLVLIWESRLSLKIFHTSQFHDSSQSFILRKKKLTDKKENMNYVIPLMWNVRISKTNLQWHKADQWLPGFMGGETDYKGAQGNICICQHSFNCALKMDTFSRMQDILYKRAQGHHNALAMVE